MIVTQILASSHRVLPSKCSLLLTRFVSEHCALTRVSQVYFRHMANVFFLPYALEILADFYSDNIFGFFRILILKEESRLMSESRLRFCFVHSFELFLKIKKSTVASPSSLFGVVLKHTDGFTLWDVFSHIESFGHFFVIR